MDEFWALKGINFSIHEGERIGILGLNGAEKVRYSKWLQEYLNLQRAG